MPTDDGGRRSGRKLRSNSKGIRPEIGQSLTDAFENPNNPDFRDQECYVRLLCFPPPVREGTDRAFVYLAPHRVDPAVMARKRHGEIGMTGIKQR